MIRVKIEKDLEIHIKRGEETCILMGTFTFPVALKEDLIKEAGSVLQRELGSPLIIQSSEQTTIEEET